MEKVVNSVQQILAECDSMLDQTKDCEYLDVLSLSKTLSSECNTLRQYYELSPDDEASIKSQKQKVERLAIRLEFFMAVRMGLYQDRKGLRDFSGTLYEDCRSITLTLSKTNAAQRELVVWGSYTNWALAFYSRSLHILFETDSDDDKQIKNIVENMKIVKEKLNNG